MQYKTLGKIGIKISSVGLGCMGLSHAFGTLLGKWEAADKVRAACDLGYTLFDTAECYTETNPDGYYRLSSLLRRWRKSTRPWIRCTWEASPAGEYGEKHRNTAE